MELFLVHKKTILKQFIKIQDDSTTPIRNITSTDIKNADDQIMVEN